MQNFDFSWQISEKYRFSRQNWLFTAISGQIILFLIKSHHFRTCFLYMKRYNNILRPVHDPPCDPLTTPPCSKSGGRDTPNPPGLTPMSLVYIVVASDLHPKHECKFADDTYMYLLVGSHHLSSATEELEHISASAMENNIRLNLNKTRELIVVRKGRKSITSRPLIIPGASRVSTIRVLDVAISSDLGIGQHLEEFIATCVSRRRIVGCPATSSLVWIVVFVCSRFGIAVAVDLLICILSYI